MKNLKRALKILSLALTDNKGEQTVSFATINGVYLIFIAPGIVLFANAVNTKLASLQTTFSGLF